ncbi:hypothetical protein HJG60_011577 [Phyllostomus discolor]|uniref:Uncharacterized protein n=1 Tax=Phyllostomus discolor TaxID=89673 RepID=A0A834E196_9CHIR|nr:hypothetical protein HJG60_011577 [Phyllostomus discolor]
MFSPEHSSKHPFPTSQRSFNCWPRFTTPVNSVPSHGSVGAWGARPGATATPLLPQAVGPLGPEGRPPHTYPTLSTQEKDTQARSSALLGWPGEKEARRPGLPSRPVWVEGGGKPCSGALSHVPA